jgi:hypothetical protein
MASKSNLYGVGIVLTLVGGIVGLIFAITSFLNIAIEGRDYGWGRSSGDPFVDLIIKLIFFILLIAIGTKRINITNLLALGIVIIIFGILGSGLGGLLAIIGGILIIIEALQ